MYENWRPVHCVRWRSAVLAYTPYESRTYYYRHDCIIITLCSRITQHIRGHTYYLLLSTLLLLLLWRMVERSLGANNQLLISELHFSWPQIAWHENQHVLLIWIMPSWVLTMAQTRYKMVHDWWPESLMHDIEITIYVYGTYICYYSIYETYCQMLIWTFCKILLSDRN